MTREEAIAVLEKEASIIDDNSIEMTAREWDEFDDLKRDAIPVAIEALSAEAVEVVHCKDCKYWKEWENMTGSCHRSENGYNWFGVDSTDYCSFGEKKDGEA